MDVIRKPDPKRKIRRKLLLAAVVVGIVITGIAISRFAKAAPSVERSLLWIDTVRQGDLLRQARALGTLVPEEIRWIAARSAGRVDRIILRPGAIVEADSTILYLANPDVEQAAIAAESQRLAAEAELENVRVQLQRTVLEAESAAATARANAEQSRLRAEVNAQLYAEGLVSKLDLQLSQVTAEQAATQHAIEQKRFAFAKDSIAPQLAVKVAEVERVTAQAKLRAAERDALQVRAGMAGVLSALPVEVGAQVQPGSNLARVADPRRLKAELKVPEMQAKDLVIGLKASVDTRNGVVRGRVSRVEPSVQNGTVTVDVALEGELPTGSRPDLSVDGVIEIESLPNVIRVGRPSFARERARTTLFRLEPSGRAERVSVEFGRASVDTIEVVSGLKPGDQVILSDLSQWDGYNALRIN
ncbi:efflux RND transporter periplasmic adaptor subunit [Nibricoccus sp. IMCC34717]|uniref:efflux RND transporter periplasmic adaptor subunit n=1 Tax=Nibricoccus sp. IMCC34717 TaxID=3034021 RepID=UPI00384D07D2